MTAFNASMDVMSACFMHRDFFCKVLPYFICIPPSLSFSKFRHFSCVCHVVDSFNRTLVWCSGVDLKKSQKMVSTFIHSVNEITATTTIIDSLFTFLRSFDSTREIHIYLLIAIHFCSIRVHHFTVPDHKKNLHIRLLIPVLHICHHQQQFLAGSTG